MIPPAVLLIRTWEPRFPLVLPLFLLWPMVWLMLILFELACIEHVRGLRPGAGWAVYRLLCATRGLRIKVDSDEDHVRLSVW